MLLRYDGSTFDIVQREIEQELKDKVLPTISFGDSVNDVISVDSTGEIQVTRYPRLQ